MCCTLDHCVELSPLALIEHEYRLEDHRRMARTAAVGARLRHPAFQRLWLGLSISYLGDQFTIIALLWFVLQLTGSGAAVGLVILCFDLPGVVTGAILGRLLDRYQPRLVMGFDNLARAALIAAIPTLYAWDRCSSGTSTCWRYSPERSRQQPRLGCERLCRTWWTTPPSIAP